MFQVRFHGRGGQGVVTAAELLSVAAFLDGHHAQAFPSFGSERTGAPVVSFCRIDTGTIRTREPVMEPDALVIQDITLIHQVDLFSGLSAQGFVLLNTARRIEELGLEELCARVPDGHLATCAATDLALQHLGRPLPNAALLGALAAFTGAVTLNALGEAIRQRFGAALGERNVAAASAAFASLAPTRERTPDAATA